MIPLMILLGLGLTAGLIGVFDDDDDVPATETMDEVEPEPESTPPLETFTDGDDGIVAQEYLQDLADSYTDLIAEGELTRAEADQLLADLEVRQGAVNVDTGDGDDEVVGSSFAETIRTGAGDDIVLAGRGGDIVDLGEGSDIYGIDQRSAVRPDDIEPFPVQMALIGTEAQLEGDGDTVFGGRGNDFIADGRGFNTLNGQGDDDFIISVDQGALQPDKVSGGGGADVLIVDEGDRVTTGSGADRVTIDVFDGVADGYALVTITDFDPTRDLLELEGNPADIVTPAPAGPGDMPVNPISVQDSDDGTAAIISVGGVPAVQVIGGQGMTLADILISV